MTRLQMALAAAATLAVTVLGGEAHARAIRLNFSDLDTASPAGAALLHERIESAARRICRDAPIFGVVSPRREREVCVTATVEDAVSRLALPELTRYAAIKTPLGPVAALEGVKAQ